MSSTEVVFFQEEDGSVPALEWMDGLNPKARAKCFVLVERLQAEGHALRRPQADFLRDGIYELRIRLGNVHHRLLYFFHGRKAAVVSHGLTKEGRVPPDEIDRAIRRMLRFKANPERYSHRSRE